MAQLAPACGPHMVRQTFSHHMCVKRFSCHASLARVGINYCVHPSACLAF